MNYSAINLSRKLLTVHVAGFTALVLSLIALGQLFGQQEKLNAAPEKNMDRETEKKALGDLQYLIGQWRGAGQPKRGSSAGSWTETDSWAWHFGKEATELHATLKDGKYFSALAIGLDPKTTNKNTNQYRLTATLPDGKTIEKFSGSRDASGTLILLREKELDKNKKAIEPPIDRPTRITIRTVAESQRVVVLYEREQGENFARLAEVGSTRVGGTFAAGAGGPECIVTGGAGTIPVEYKGKTYYVCCSGCKAAFNDEPEKIIKEYNARLVKKK